ncbi:MAG TPA: peptidylprolyl isomerase [Gaiellaceae bacterium]
MRLRFSLPFLVFALLIAGCGGSGSKTTTGGTTGTTTTGTTTTGSSKLTTADIAVVDTFHITQLAFNTAIQEQKASLKNQGQTVPAAGSTAFAAFKSGVVAQLVQQAELGIEAGKLGLTVTPDAVAKALTTFKKQCCKSNEKTYQKGLKQQGYTDTELQANLKERLLEQKLYNSVTKGAKASDAEIAAYYAQNITQYQKPATRKVEEILVGKNKEALAKQIYTQVKGGTSFATLAKKYSQDPGSKNIGGKFTANQGSDVPEFDKAVFAAGAKTNVLLEPVKTAQYGWFVIQPLADITPAKTTPEKQAAAAIRKQLDATKQSQAASDWLTKIEKNYCGGHKIKYQTGFMPSPDPCSTLTTSVPTTT